jgi:hypothetical protein
MARPGDKHKADKIEGEILSALIRIWGDLDWNDKITEKIFKGGPIIGAYRGLRERLGEVGFKVDLRAENLVGLGEQSSVLELVRRIKQCYLAKGHGDFV